MKIIEEEEKTGALNNLELLEGLFEVGDLLSGQVKKDYVMAYFSAEDTKQAIVDLVDIALKNKNLMVRSLKTKKWEWDIKNNKWFKRDLNKLEIKEINLINNSTFSMYLTRPQMKCILARNHSSNPMVMGILKETKEKQEIIEQEKPNIGNKLLNKLGLK